MSDGRGTRNALPPLLERQGLPCDLRGELNSLQYKGNYGMKAIILDKPEQLRLLQMEEPQASGPDEALVRVRQVGVCGTDFHAFRGEQPFFTYPRILGHELG